MLTTRLSRQLLLTQGRIGHPFLVVGRQSDQSAAFSCRSIPGKWTLQAGESTDMTVDDLAREVRPMQHSLL